MPYKKAFEVICLHTLLCSKLGCRRGVYIQSHGASIFHARIQKATPTEEEEDLNTYFHFKRTDFPFCRLWLQRKQGRIPGEEYVAGDWRWERR